MKHTYSRDRNQEILVIQLLICSIFKLMYVLMLSFMYVLMLSFTGLED